MICYILQLYEECIISGKHPPIKVGWTNNLFSRLAAYRTHCPFQLKLIAATENSPQITEQNMKSSLSCWQELAGGGLEWFRPPPEELAKLLIQYNFETNGPSLLKFIIPPPKKNTIKNEKPNKTKMTNIEFMNKKREEAILIIGQFQSVLNIKSNQPFELDNDDFGSELMHRYWFHNLQRIKTIFPNIHMCKHPPIHFKLITFVRAWISMLNAYKMDTPELVLKTRKRKSKTTRLHIYHLKWNL